MFKFGVGLVTCEGERGNGEGKGRGISRRRGGKKNGEGKGEGSKRGSIEGGKKRGEKKKNRKWSGRRITKPSSRKGRGRENFSQGIAESRKKTPRLTLK